MTTASTQPAPCAGFVWFRWLRPSRRHRYEPCWVAFYGLTAVIVPERLMPQFLIANRRESGRCRRTLDYCAGCGKARLWS